MPAVMQCVDVGQGNCTVVVDEEGHGIVVDCPRGKAERAITAARQLGVTNMVAVIASHNDLDHVGAVVTVADTLGANELRSNHATTMPADPGARAKLRAVLLQIADLDDRGIPNRPATCGQSGTIGGGGGIAWSILAPTHAQIGVAQAQNQPNHASVVLSLECDGWVALLPGDADGASFDKLRRDRCNIRADILVVPHHGADVAPTGEVTDMGWILRAVGAPFCVVSAGSPAQYGHPTPTTQTALGSNPVVEWWCTHGVNGGPGGSVTVTLRADGITVAQG